METPLDRALAAMEADPGDEALRLGFHERLADGELFLLLSAEPEGATLDPEVVPADGGRYVLAFDREARLAGFVGGPAPYAALSGRTLAGMLAGQGLGIALNLGTPGETLVAAEAVDWLAGVLGARPEAVSERPVEVFAPRGLPERLVGALSVKLALAEGLAEAAWLAGVRYAGGRRGHLLAILGARPGAEAAQAQAVSEALVFSGAEAGVLDVVFPAAGDPLGARLSRGALCFETPAPPAPPGPPFPEGPPRLR